MYNWVILLYAWNKDNIVNQLYSNKTKILKKSSKFYNQNPKKLFDRYFLKYKFKNNYKYP